MAEPKLKEKEPPKSVSVDEFQEFQKNVFDSLKSLTTLISEKQATPEAAKETRAVAEAGPDDAPVNPSWRRYSVPGLHQERTQQRDSRILGDAQAGCADQTDRQHRDYGSGKLVQAHQD